MKTNVDTKEVRFKLKDKSKWDEAALKAAFKEKGGWDLTVKQMAK